MQVTTQLPGASPDVIASLITAPLGASSGRSVAIVDAVDSSFGVSQISLQFDLNRDRMAPPRTQAAINAAAESAENLPYRRLRQR